MTNSGPPELPDLASVAADFLTFFAVTEQLQAQNPTKDRAALLRQLRPLHDQLMAPNGNNIADGNNADTQRLDLNTARLDVLNVLARINAGSLGTPAARALRAQTSPTAAAGVLARAAAIEQMARRKALVAEAETMAAESTDLAAAHSRLQEIRDELTILDAGSMKDTARLWRRLEDADATLAHRREPAAEAASPATNTAPRGTTAADFVVLLGIDVIDSASIAPHLLPQVPTVLQTLLAAGMNVAGVPRDDAVDAQYTGDGWLYAFPSTALGQVVDLGPALAAIVAEHNKWNKLELRLRLAVDLGPRPAGQGFYPSNIARARLLEAPAYKALALRCRAERPDGSMSTATILSDAAYVNVFRDDLATIAQRTDFTALAVTNKEFTARAWVGVPGFDARTLDRMIADDTPGTAISKGLVDRRVTNTGTRLALYGAVIVPSKSY